MPVDIQFQPQRGLDGILTIRAAGVPDVKINDELWWHLMDLARAAGELAEGRAAAVSYSGMPGAYELTPDGEDVVVSGDYFAAVRYPRGEFVSAVLDASERWLNYARASGDPEHLAVAPDVANAIAETRAMLSAQT